MTRPDLRYLFLPRSHTSDIADILMAAFRSDITVLRWSPDDPWRPPSDCSLHNATVYGGLRNCRAVAAGLGGSLLEPPPDLLSAAPFEYVKRRVELTTLGEVRTLTQAAFVKPASVKAFPATVHRPGQSGAPSVFNGYADQLPVLVSEIVEWAIEVRLFMVGGRVHASTVYRYDPTHTPTPADLLAAVRLSDDLLSDGRVRLPDAVVLDVGLIPDRGWAIVEANPLNASSFYDCDATTILRLLPHGIVATLQQ